MAKKNNINRERKIGKQDIENHVGFNKKLKSKIKD